MENNEELFSLNSLLDDEGLEEGDTFNPFEDGGITDVEEEEENIEEEEKEKEVAEEEETPPEKVGSDDEDKGSAAKPKKGGSSPSDNIYSSIANLLKEDGAFPDLNDDDLSGITDTDSFVEAIQKQITSSIDEEYRRIDKALGVGVQPDVINSYRSTIKYLDSLTEDVVKDENNVEIRKALIMQDLINKGYSKERAERSYQKSFDKGEEVDDALEALEANKEFYNSKYDELLEDAENQQKEIKAENEKKAKAFKKSIMEDKNLYGDFEVSNQMRQSIYDAVTKPIYTDKTTGRTLTAVQKWQLDKPDEFMKAVGFIYKITNGGQDYSKLIQKEVKKKVSKAREEFENAIRNSSANTSGGKFRFANAHDDSESFLKGFTLDI